MKSVVKVAPGFIIFVSEHDPVIIFLVIAGYVEPLKWITKVNECVPP